jgi:hypothetical protein
MWLPISVAILVVAFVLVLSRRAPREWKLLDDGVEITLSRNCQFTLAYPQFRSATRLHGGPKNPNVHIRLNEPVSIRVPRKPLLSWREMRLIFRDVDEFVEAMCAKGVADAE